jgi:hypothetical protein
MRGPNDGTAAQYWQVTNKSRTPCRRMLPSVIGQIGSPSLAITKLRTDRKRNQVAVIGSWKGTNVGSVELAT